MSIGNEKFFNDYLTEEKFFEQYIDLLLWRDLMKEKYAFAQNQQQLKLRGGCSMAYESSYILHMSFNLKTQNTNGKNE